MKKLLSTISFLVPFFVLITVMMVFGRVEVPIPQPADIWCWRSDTVEFGQYNLNVFLLESIYGEPLLTHADVVVDDNDTLRTSIQNEGVSESNIELRKKQFNMGILLRNPSLTDSQIKQIVNTTYNLHGDYDWGGYYGQVMDYLFRLPWMPEKRFFTYWLQDENAYYCSEFVASSFDIEVSARDDSLTSPLDFYYYALDTNDWEVIYTWEKGDTDTT